jgi:hypothetical protein
VEALSSYADCSVFHVSVISLVRNIMGRTTEARRTRKRQVEPQMNTDLPVVLKSRFIAVFYPCSSVVSSFSERLLGGLVEISL